MIQGSYWKHLPYKCTHDLAQGMSTIGPKYSDTRLPLESQYMIETCKKKTFHIVLTRKTIKSGGHFGVFGIIVLPDILRHHRIFWLLADFSYFLGFYLTSHP